MDDERLEHAFEMYVPWMYGEVVMNDPMYRELRNAYVAGFITAFNLLVNELPKLKDQKRICIELQGIDSVVEEYKLELVAQRRVRS